MYPFFETVRIEGRRIHNRIWHNRRLNRTLYDRFGIRSDYDIADYIDLPSDDGLYRCKLLYGPAIGAVTLTPYRRRRYRSLQCIDAEISYSYKSTDRSAIDALFSRRGESDDIIIVRDGLLTDTSIANIALFDGLHWYTPEVPLLEGTMRASLIDAGLLRTRRIDRGFLRKSTEFALLNAMTGLYQLKNIILKF